MARYRLDYEAIGYATSMPGDAPSINPVRPAIFNRDIVH
jgi:hypothetical protein